MNGELAQVVTLVAFGNLFLQDGNNSILDASTNSTFKYVSSLKFARYRGTSDTQPVVVANTVADWFAFLRAIHATRLSYVAFAWLREDIPEHLAMAYANGISRAIQADLPDGFELWYPQWNAGPGSKPWSVEYRALWWPQSATIPIPPWDVVKQELQKAITHAIEFDNKFSRGGWNDQFAGALKLFDAPNPQIVYHPDMLPDDGYSLEARQTLAAAVRAYVFGGMGSWNDQIFAEPETQTTYLQVTNQLAEAVKLAIYAAANSFGR